MSGTPLGRPPKNISIETKKQAIEDERICNYIEGKFGLSTFYERWKLTSTVLQRRGKLETAISTLTVCYSP